MLAREAFERSRDLAGRVANAYLRKLPTSIEAREIHTIALGGLWEVALKYHGLPKNEFEAMAIVRIRGAIADDLRKRDDFPRLAREGYGKLWRMLHSDALENLDSIEQYKVFSRIEEAVDRRDRARWLLKMVGRLPEQQRLIMGRLLTGETQSEIGRSLGLSQARVCQVVTAARDALRENWEGRMRR